MPIVNDDTLDVTYPELQLDERVHIVINHDEMSIATNEQHRRLWLAEGQQPLRKKGNGRSVHVSDFILETTGHLCLTQTQLGAQAQLLIGNCLRKMDARTIIYPGKNPDAWWDMAQLLTQIKDTIPIFEYLHPGAIGIWVFDCSLAHEALANDALNIKNMNIKAGGKQRSLHPTIIPVSNPPPKPGKCDTCGDIQEFSYPTDHPNADFRGKPKGICAIVMECTSVWDALCEASGSERQVKNICSMCKASQVEKDCLAHVAAMESTEGNVTVGDGTLGVPKATHRYCCVTGTLSQQQDFLDEKPFIQTYIEAQGHICMFLPKFHCELDPIEMYWGWAKHSECLHYHIVHYVHN